MAPRVIAIKMGKFNCWDDMAIDLILMFAFEEMKPA